MSSVLNNQAWFVLKNDFFFSPPEDYDGALGVFTEMAYLAQERGGNKFHFRATLLYFQKKNNNGIDMTIS